MFWGGFFVVGLLMCITIIGIPFGVQLMKIGVLALAPFGKNVTTKDNAGCLSIGFSVLWILFGWWEIAIVHLLRASELPCSICKHTRRPEWSSEG